MILVVGGTGTLGRELVPRLIASGHDVRTLTRDAAREAAARETVPGVEFAAGDLRDAASIAAVLEGVNTVVSAAHGFLGGRGAGPEEIDDAGNRTLVAAARDAGVEHVVLLSVLGARPDHPMALHRAKYAAEEHVRRSGLSWTILRPSSYIETWVDVVGGRLTTGGPGLVLGRGQNPINFVSVKDVATVALRAITDPSLRGQVVDIAGADNLTMVELLDLLGAAHVRRIPRGLLRVLATTLPLVTPAPARQAHAALVMDTTDMTATPAGLVHQLPGIDWHPAHEVVREYAGSATVADP